MRIKGKEMRLQAQKQTNKQTKEAHKKEKRKFSDA